MSREAIGGSVWTRRGLAAMGVFGLVFLTVPLVIVIPMSFSSARALTFPP
ncbi:MAG: ABC transporter permease, partial [Reyranella sp.]